MRHQRPSWLLTRWSKRQRQAADEAIATAVQEAEQRAARLRVLEAATTVLPVVRPVPAPVVRPSRPLLTRGQEARSRRNQR